jgi:ElaB/YqjD/DUF883 family membrane-anchored ribosome-binding protein
MAKQNTIATITITAKLEPDSKELKKQAKKAKTEEKQLRSKVNTMIQKTKSQIKQLYRVYGSASPAVKALQERGTTLSVKGKNYQQLQSTYFSLDKFLKAQTSTVQGAEQVLNETAQIIGNEKLSASTIKELASEFFNIAHKAEQMLQNDTGFWGGSTRIFQAIREIQKQAGTQWKQAQTIEEKASVIADKLAHKQEETLYKNEMAIYVEKIEKNIESWMK